MKKIKYPIQEVSLKTIPNNKMLSLGISPKDKALCEKSIQQYGMLWPIVVMENQDGELTTVTGEHELEVLKGMNVSHADVIMAKLKEKSDTGTIILLLNDIHKGLNPISEGMILRDLINIGGYSQKELADMFMKSKSWVCKRLLLAEQLNENVSDLVFSKQLHSACAQVISGLPKEVQHEFAMEVCANRIPKASVERLVSAYNSKKTPDELKEDIIRNPLLASACVVTGEAPVKYASNHFDSQEKFDGTLRLLLKIVCGLEEHLARMAQADIKKYQTIMESAERALHRFAKLLQVSLGKQYIAQGGIDGDY